MSAASVFSADVVAAMPGPDWLAAKRASAWERFSSMSMPSEREEIWRYSGIDKFDLQRFSPVGSADPAQAAKGHMSEAIAKALSLAQRLGPRSGLVVTFNGSVRTIELTPALAERSVVVGGSGDEEFSFGELARAKDALGELHDAFISDVVRVKVPNNVVFDDPIVVIHIVEESDEASQAFFPHLWVSVGECSQAGMIEITSSFGGNGKGIDDSQHGKSALMIGATELYVSDNAHLRYANLQLAGDSLTYMGSQASRVGRDGSLRSFTAALGGSYSRVVTDNDVVGQGGTSALLAAYLGTGSQVHDFRTTQDHHAPHTESELLFKGAVADEARSVYSGLIRIRKGAKASNAFQTNQNLVLSQGAHADSVPNLDIEENDVRCSHASTVGPIDEEQRYYLQSRGIDPVTTDRLIVAGFFADLVRRAPFSDLSGQLENLVDERLQVALRKGFQ